MCREQDEEWELNILIGRGWRGIERAIREIVIDYIRKANERRNKSPKILKKWNFSSKTHKFGDF